MTLTLRQRTILKEGGLGLLLVLSGILLLLTIPGWFALVVGTLLMGLGFAGQIRALRR